MYQPKVKNTEKHSDSQGKHIVCRGKLVLIDQKNSDYPMPYIISETEEIEEGDWYYWEPTKQIRKAHKHGSRDLTQCHKILALPEHFSDKHLQAIVDGKMKDGDEVLVKCDSIQGVYDKVPGDLNYGVETYTKGYKVYLDQQNHITLFPAKQEPKSHQPLVVKDAYGEVWNIGDKVTHSGVPEDETATIESFYVDYQRGEIRADTTRGNAGLDYLTKVPAKQSLEEAVQEFRKKEGLVEISDGTHLIDTVKKAIKFGAEWATNHIFDWLEEKDLLTDDKSVIKEEWAKKNNY